MCRAAFRPPAPLRLPLAAIALVLLAGRAGAEDAPAPAADRAAGAPAAPRAALLGDDLIAPGVRWRLELQRQNTDRGSSQESTNTTLKLSHFPGGEVERLRLQVPFPDGEQTFHGSLFNPHLGDIQVRMDLKGFRAWGPRLSPFVEVTFPTADPSSLGARKYQVAPGIETHVPFRWTAEDDGADAHAWSWGALLQQVVSVAGDASAKDINYSKGELSLADIWDRRYSLKLTFKPVVNWQRDYATGAVLELEGGMRISRAWTLELMGGHGLWGVGQPATYQTRLQLTIGYDF